MWKKSNTHVLSNKGTDLPCRDCAIPCSSLILPFNMTDRGVKHTGDYAPCSIVNRQKTKESACEQAD